MSRHSGSELGTHNRGFPESSQGSDRGAFQVVLILVLASFVVGGISTLSGGASSPLIGTWWAGDGTSFQSFRFAEDGTYWFESRGWFGVSLAGTYKVVGRQGDEISVVLSTELGEMESSVRVESDSRISIRSDEEGDEDFERAADWALAKKPSPRGESFEGERPHLGCWQRDMLFQPATYEFRADGSVVDSSEAELQLVEIAVDYSKIPFEIDLTYSDGRVVQEIFQFHPDGALLLGSHRLAPGARPQQMASHDRLVPCSAQETH